jgi:antitoxin (DNA-binding transcriptional repressor) of toxin-antitoxin stability system
MVKAKDFRSNLGSYLDKAKAGSSTAITRQGQHIATLVSAQPRSPLLLPLRARVAFGAHTFDGGNNSLSRFFNLQTKLGKSLDIFHQFANWIWPWSWANDVVEFAHHNGSAPLITWQVREVNLNHIVLGKHNLYIDSWAKGIKSVKQPVYLRIFPEMNLKNPDITWGQADPKLLIRAWKHIVNRFRVLNVRNVFWVWSPNRTDQDGAYKLEDYYPGSDVVDILAVDGYNFGDGNNHLWRSFEETFEEPYSRIVILDLHKPFWITETACAETGNGRKAKWVNEMFASTKFPSLKAIVWFDENKERDWRMSSSGQTLAAFKQEMPVLV